MSDIEEQTYKIKERNKDYLELFRKYLELQGLKNKTISNHVFNAGFFINEFLCYYQPLSVEAGIIEVNEFFSDWFIRKAMWSSEATLKATITSIKKFYKFMMELGIVSEDEYESLLETIRFEKENWLEQLEMYDSGIFF